MTEKWRLTGTASQQAVVRAAFARIKFPLDILALPGVPELGWRDLNTGAYGSLALEAEERGRSHEGVDHSKEEKPEPQVGELNGRRMIMGVFYPLSARIFIDQRLEAHPEAASATLAAEIAHAVDEFMPMTDAMRHELLRLWNQPGTTWWEVFDYGREYFRLGGEAFMHEFVHAYSDIDYGNKSSFLHDAGVEPEDVWRILGVRRTDYVAPAPPAPPPAAPPFLVYGTSKVFHKPTHYPRKKTGVAVTGKEPGLRPCLVCKP